MVREEGVEEGGCWGGVGWSEGEVEMTWSGPIERVKKTETLVSETSVYFYETIRVS
jgi:hypothetical protein